MLTVILCFLVSAPIPQARPINTPVGGYLVTWNNHYTYNYELLPSGKTRWHEKGRADNVHVGEWEWDAASRVLTLVDTYNGQRVYFRARLDKRMHGKGLSEDVPMVFVPVGVKDP
jgi:hypothetical protein